MDNQADFLDVAISRWHIVQLIQDITSSDAILFRGKDVAMTILILVNQMVELSTLRVNHSEVFRQQSLSVQFLEQGNHFGVCIELHVRALIHDRLPYQEVCTIEKVPTVMDSNRMHLALSVDFLDHLIREVKGKVKHILQ